MRIAACLLALTVIGTGLHAQPQKLHRKPVTTNTQNTQTTRTENLQPLKRKTTRLTRLSDAGYTMTNEELKQISETYHLYKRAKDASVMVTIAGSSYAAIAKTQGATAEGVQKALNVLGFYQVKPGLAASRQAEMLAAKMRGASFLRAKVLRPVMYVAAAVAVYEVYQGINSGTNPKGGAIINGERSSKH
ncbi:hypothetical protein [Polluticoccus soli]|uniref:hypothetical protein n=1 Tax=Polluticoccus soli TaxID=3034150 RepID=UPI0023E27E93|nr:hypothetical protein [Flavipsychrobacter sp. JY13-12]